MHSQESEASSGDDDTPQPVGQQGKAKETATESPEVPAQGMKPELQAALSAAVPVLKTSDLILPDLAECIKDR